MADTIQYPLGQYTTLRDKVVVQFRFDGNTMEQVGSRPTIYNGWPCLELGWDRLDPLGCSSWMSGLMSYFKTNNQRVFG